MKKDPKRQSKESRIKCKTNILTKQNWPAILLLQELYYTLTTQLDKQRQFYEEKIARIESNAQREMDEVLKRAK